MKLQGATIVVTGGGSGLGDATARRLAERGATVCVIDLADADESAPSHVAAYSSADVTDDVALSEAFRSFAERHGPIRGVVHCAGRGGDRVRILDKDGNAAPLNTFAEVVKVNLFGTYNVLRLGAREIARAEPRDGERGAIVLTASVAAFDGQIGQAAYSASKGGIVGLTLPAARDLAQHKVRVNTIAPGLFFTPLLMGLSEEARNSLGAQVPHPARLGDASEYGNLAVHIVENAMLNGETIRLDGAIRMAPR